MEMELRTLATDIELREAEDKKRSVSGYAVKWDQLSEKMGWSLRFREKFRPGSFTESLTKRNQKALWNHNTDLVLGNVKSGTLQLDEDDTGLRFILQLPDNTWGQDAYESIRRGDVDGVSFGFTKQGDEWDETDPDNVVRTITKANLFEVSPTPFPAYPQTEVQARALDKIVEDYRATAQPVTDDTPEPDPDPKLSELRKDLWRIRRKVNQIKTEE